MHHGTAIWLATVLLSAASVAADVDHTRFELILRDGVRSERVDYLIIRERHWERLNEYLAELTAVTPAELEEDERLAYYINLYNATVIKVVIERFTVDYRVSEHDFKVFDEPLVALRSGKVSLNHLEHEIIRKQFDEPRIHVALVCAAVSCPPLLPFAYTGDRLDEVLQKKMEAFVRGGKRNRIEEGGRLLKLSKIFEWYAADFGGKDQLAAYVDRYARENTSGAKVEFVEYDWALNYVPPRAGKWFQIAADEVVVRSAAGGGEPVATLRRGQVVRVIEREGNHLEIAVPLSDRRGWIMAMQTRPFRGLTPR